jgi:hypothetical protein
VFSQYPGSGSELGGRPRGAPRRPSCPLLSPPLPSSSGCLALRSLGNRPLPAASPAPPRCHLGRSLATARCRLEGGAGGRRSRAGAGVRGEGGSGGLRLNANIDQRYASLGIKSEQRIGRVNVSRSPHTPSRSSRHGCIFDIIIEMHMIYIGHLFNAYLPSGLAQQGCWKAYKKEARWEQHNPGERAVLEAPPPNQ